MTYLLVFSLEQGTHKDFISMIVLLRWLGEGGLRGRVVLAESWLVILILLGCITPQRNPFPGLSVLQSTLHEALSAHVKKMYASPAHTLGPWVTVKCKVLCSPMMSSLDVSETNLEQRTGLEPAYVMSKQASTRGVVLRLHISAFTARLSTRFDSFLLIVSAGGITRLYCPYDRPMGGVVRAEKDGQIPSQDRATNGSTLNCRGQQDSPFHLPRRKIQNKRTIMVDPVFRLLFFFFATLWDALSHDVRRLGERG